MNESLYSWTPAKTQCLEQGSFHNPAVIAENCSSSTHISEVFAGAQLRFYIDVI